MKSIIAKYIKPLIIPLIVLLLFFCFQWRIEGWLYDFCASWLSWCNKLAGGLIIVLLAALTTWYLWEKCRKMKLSLNHAGWLLFLLILYVYYRIDDTLYFWTFTICRVEIAFTDLFAVPLIVLLRNQFDAYNYEVAPADETACLLDKDEPIDDEENDEFGYGNSARSLLKDLKLLELKEKSFSVGIAGEWGLGKSSFFQLFKKLLRSEFGENVIIVEFNPRSSAAVKDIQKDFFDTFANQVSRYYSGIMRDMSRYQEALQLPEDSLVVRMLRLLPSLTVSNGKDVINEVIDNLHKRIFVFVDDFDRLTAEEILEVMKVIDRNGDFHHTIYLTAYDKDYVNSVLRKYLGYNRRHVFTDKYFSHELHLPPQSNDALKNYVRKTLEAKLKDNSGDAISVKEILTQWDGVGNLVVNHLHTLRHVKRFMNIFLSRYNKVRNDVNLGDFLRVTLLRYFDIGTYHALVEGRLTKDGGLLSATTDQVIYQADDMEERLKRYSKWEDAKQVLDELISKSSPNDFNLTSRYKRLQMKDSFACYFYDYLPDGVYYKDLMQLYDASTEEEAVEILKTLIKFDKEKHSYNQGAYIAVENFLRIRPMGELRWSGDVVRLFRLLCYLNTFLARPINLQSSIAYFFSKKAVDELDDLMENDYKGKFQEVVMKEIGENPLSLAFIIGTINLDMLNPEVNEGDYVFNRQEIQELTELCQRCYFNLAGGINHWNFDTIMTLSKVMMVENGKQVVSDNAKSLFVNFITNHADDFAKSAISVVKTHTELPKLNVSIKNSFISDTFFPYQGVTIKEWIENHVTDESVSKIFIRLLKEQERKLSVDIEGNPLMLNENDYQRVYDLIRISDEQNEEGAVLAALKFNVANSIQRVSIQTSISEQRVKDALKRMVEKSVLSRDDADIAAIIPTFAEGDFVCVKERHEEGKGQMAETFNVRMIAKLEDGKAILQGVTGSVEIAYLDAVPIDGVHDKNIYYEPRIAGSDGSFIGNSDDYYMDSFKNTINENGKSYYDIVKERGYHFVHEIQHWLHDEKDYGMKIRK